MLCVLQGCIKCGGDLVLDDSDWRCVQCSKYYYMNPTNATTADSLLLQGLVETHAN